MTRLDVAVLAAYLLGMLVLGVRYVGRNRGARDMFAAGGRSPWWVSGLSGFMTLKSAGTFVVWGGLAYREGVVAIAINMCIGISGLLVGWVVAGRWRQLGVTTPAEFVQLRFGPNAVQLYTWAMMALRIVSTGVALYAVAVMLVALVPLAPGHPLRDEATGLLSLPFAILLFGAIVVVYTAVGGLWAVLMTDVMQFIVLQLSVLLLIPLLWLRLDTTAPLAVPAGFFSPFSAQYTPWFMIGWIAVHFFLVGAEWAFAQRYLCVPSPRDARKSAYLFGALYLVSPALWLTPPLLFRLLRPGVDSEQAYILAAQAVLPAGMLGMTMAAMFAATASSLSGQINVFAGVLTDQFYRRLYRPAATEHELVRAGRRFALLIGAVVMIVAILIPRLGGAEKIVLTLTGMLFGPLLAPTIWGLLSGRIGTGAVFTCAFGSFAAGLWVRLGADPGGPFDGGWMAQWIQANPRVTDILVGVVLPVLILSCAQLLGRGDRRQWQAVRARMATAKSEAQAERTDISGDHSPARVVAISLATSGLLMLGLAAFNRQAWEMMVSFGIALLMLATVAGWGAAQALLAAWRHSRTTPSRRA